MSARTEALAERAAAIAHRRAIAPEQVKLLNLASNEAKRRYFAKLERERNRHIARWEKKLRSRFRAEMRSVKAEIAAGAAAFELSSAPWLMLLMTLYGSISRAFGAQAARQLAEADKSVRARRKAAADLWWSLIERYVAENVGTKVLGILATTRESIKATLLEGMREGEGVHLLSERIERLYLDDIIPHRSEVIARTEVIQMANFASQAAAGASGLKLEREWYATADARTRLDHRAANGQRQPYGKPYSVGGSKLMYPGDSSLGAGADQVVNCRCAELFHTVR
jgi:uncharacterized protein with gpF-like domain